MTLNLKFNQNIILRIKVGVRKQNILKRVFSYNFHQLNLYKKISNNSINITFQAIILNNNILPDAGTCLEYI